jgi:hypothetical protein
MALARDSLVTPPVRDRSDSNHQLTTRSDALPKRGSELISRIDAEAYRHRKQAEAKHPLDRAWTELAIGTDDARRRGTRRSHLD